VITHHFQYGDHESAFATAASGRPGRSSCTGTTRRTGYVFDAVKDQLAGELDDIRAAGAVQVGARDRLTAGRRA